MNTADSGSLGRRRRRKHSPAFKAKVVAACHTPGVSIAAVALSNGLNANLLRRWVVMAERTQVANRIDTVHAAPAHSNGGDAFIPVQVQPRVVATDQGISIELRRGATVVKIGWPLAAAGECAAWLRELLR